MRKKLFPSATVMVTCSLFFLVLFSSVVQAQFSNQNKEFMPTPSGTLNNAHIFTVEFWVKTTENRSNNTYWQRPYLFGNATDGDNSGDFGIITNNGYIGMWEGVSNLNTDQQFLSNSIRINDDFWHHIAAVNNGQTLNLYVDGQLTGSLVSGRQLFTNTAPLTFGAASVDRNYGGGYNNVNFISHASFGEARISNIALYNSNFNPPNSFFSDANTVAVYHFSNQNNSYGNNQNLAVNLDPNRPVTIDPSQPINNNLAQPATLFLNDSTVVYGKLLIGKKDWSLSNELYIRFFENNSKKVKYFKPEEIKGFQMGDSYYEPKFLGSGGAISTPFKKTMVKRLTPPGSKMAMYEYDTETNTKNANGYIEYKNVIIYFVQLPGAKDDKVYQFSDNKFTPKFDTKVSAIVQDKPALADKIRNKDKDFFYAFVTQDTHQLNVWWNIINEYNRP